MNDTAALFLASALLAAAAAAHAGDPDTSCDRAARSARVERAAKGDAKAQYWLGTELDRGSCGVRDPDRARALLKQSAESNFPPAVHILGVIARRDGNDAEALKYFEKSAALGFQMGFADMGFTYGQEASPVRNAAQSYAWLTVAIARDQAGGSRDFLEGARSRLAKSLSDPELAKAKAAAADLTAKYASTPVWSDTQ